MDPTLLRACIPVVLQNIQREYPNKLDHVINGKEDLKSPKELHPVFYGSFDWHSAVHSHWFLVKALKSYDNLLEDSQKKEIRHILHKHFTPDNVRGEIEYLNQPSRESFERTYGWAWILKLTEELYTWKDQDAQKWLETLQPLTNMFVKRYMTFLPRLSYPIRTGVHPNTAFALDFALSYGRTTGNQQLVEVVEQRVRSYYAKDKMAPLDWEPSGEDFFSPCLMEADLMSKVLPQSEFMSWLREFLPRFFVDDDRPLLEPAQVDQSDRSDPKLVHLDGLNLSRSWNLLSLASKVSDMTLRKRLKECSKVHEDKAVNHILSGDYVGQHWLATFAMYIHTHDFEA